MSDSETTAVSVVSKIEHRAPSTAAALVVIHGAALGKKFELGPRVTVGRAATCEIRIDQESVSRVHASFSTDGRGGYVVRDEGSTNGTLVNDRALDDEGWQLSNGDLIKIGRTIFKFISSNNVEAEYHDEVYRLTTMDGLTQVLNRRAFNDALAREVARANRYHRELSVLLADVDHFKQVNDRYGHLAGDAVLRHVAAVLRSNVRKEDVLARFGGEEFGLVLPEIILRGALILAEKLRRLVEHTPVTFDGESISVTMSVGVASMTGGDTDASLLERADQRLYQAKQEGRNCVRS